MKLKFFRTSQYNSLEEAANLGGVRTIQISNDSPATFGSDKVSEIVGIVMTAVNMVDSNEEVQFVLTQDDDQIITSALYESKGEA